MEKDVSITVPIETKIQRVDGRWLVNNTRYENLTATEKEFLSRFITYMKEAYEIENEIYTYSKKIEVKNETLLESALNKLTNNTK